MRLLLKLRCTETGKYEMQYHYHLQGFIYNLLRDSKYHYIHNKEGYRFFCFSNIFPAKNLEKNDLRTLMITSPDNEFIDYLFNALLQPNVLKVKIGSMKFRIDYVDKLIVRIPISSPFTLVTGTPIIVRIPKDKYELYVSEPNKIYDYIYWRSNHPIELFISQIENNLFKKYIEYYGLNTSKDTVHYENISTELRTQSVSFLQKIKFKKQISTRVFMKGFDEVIIGTIWEFGFNIDANKDIIQFALDSGLGERNSLGFGFMNLNRVSYY